MGGRIRDLHSHVSYSSMSRIAVSGALEGLLRTHESPEAERKVLGQRVERQVVSWALWVVVWGGHLGAGAGEATAGGHLGHWADAESGTGKHLHCQISISVIAACQLMLSEVYIP